MTPADAGSLEGRVALVTGAGRLRGIGRGIVHELAGAGAAVAVHARVWDADPWPLEELNDGDPVALVEGDLTDREVVRNMVEQVAEQLGSVDILVNNAGIAGAAGQDRLVELDDEVWYRTVDVNLNAVYQVTKAFLPGMVEKGRGAIVNISSVAGRAGQPRMGAYVATKFALVGLTQQLALEYAPELRVNCICPGSTDTEMMDGTFARRDAAAGARPGTAKATRIAGLPLRRQGQPADIGRAVRFLVSDDADWITGQTLNVDGGQLMN
jgi:NAD(P)-dependent dehydrogenase (short-subunit alcohol dehydrogenase family)